MSATVNTATSHSSRSTRPYRMKERAESTAATRGAIIEAALALGDVRVPLAEVAARAGVTPRTILRHFGDRNGLFVAVLESARERIAEQRFAVEAGDVDAAAGELRQDRGEREQVAARGARVCVDRAHRLRPPITPRISSAIDSSVCLRLRPESRRSSFHV